MQIALRMLFAVFMSVAHLKLCYSQHLNSGSSSRNETYFFRNDVEKRLVTDDYIGIYQRFIGGIRGHECPMYPSCSNYGLKTFKETNFLHAFALTSDRVLRCGHDHQYYPLTLTQGGFRYLDFSAIERTPKDLVYTRNQYSFYYADTIPDEYSSQFIATLINGQYHREALLEMMRLEYSMGILPLELFINKIICLKSLGDYESAIFEFENKCPIDYKSNVELIYQMALVYYKLENYAQAKVLLSEIMAFDYDSYTKSKVIMLNAILCAQSNDWQQCQDAYASLEELDTCRELAAINLGIVSRGLSIRDKSPVLAGCLSIIPGLGYAYSGHVQTAISALLVNGLLAFATYSNITSSNYGMAMLTGVFNVSFYVGNLVGSLKSAKRFNVQKRQSIINKLKYNSNL